MNSTTTTFYQLIATISYILFSLNINNNLDNNAKQRFFFSIYGAFAWTFAGAAELTNHPV